jgi:hypothetical protein
MRSFLSISSASIFLTSLTLTSTSAAEESSTCLLWLAPSHVSTEANPKYGLFAGVEYTENQTLPNPELALPLIDFLESPNRKSDPRTQEILEHVESFLWTSEYAGAKWEGNVSTTILVPGSGVLANYHSGIYNVDWSQGSVLLRERQDITEPGKAHPSRGAISPYHNMTIRATQNIKAGMELFANFGDVWDESEKDRNIYQDKINRWDYMEADKVLDSVLEFMDTYGGEMTDDLKDEALDFILETLLGTAAGKHAKVIRSLSPDNFRKLRKVKEMGGSFHYRNADLVKSTAWFEKHGMCVDKIVSGTSTIPEAGRGAFSTRQIKTGEIIVPVPMVAIANEDLMEMYAIPEGRVEEKFTNFDKGADLGTSIGKQLAYNYCFGHQESSILLLPVGPMVTLVNHGTNGKANAYLDWSDHPYVYNDDELHDINPDALASAPNPNIVMNLIATREIAPGEEILIDYGPDWVAAWEEYMAGYDVKYADGKWPLKAEDVMLDYIDEPFPVNLTPSTSPYPKGVATTCFIETVEIEDGLPAKTEDGVEILQWIGPQTFADYKGHHYFACDLVEITDSHKDGHMFNYTVMARHSDSEVLMIKDVPHGAITLIDLPYTSDIHTPGAFRQWIAIEDRLFPQAWRNMRE